MQENTRRLQIKEKALGSGVCADCLRPGETDFAIAKAAFLLVKAVEFLREVLYNTINDTGVRK